MISLSIPFTYMCAYSTMIVRLLSVEDPAIVESPTPQTPCGHHKTPKRVLEDQGVAMKDMKERGIGRGEGEIQVGETEDWGQETGGGGGGGVPIGGSMICLNS